jgi:flavin-dependent dehydrogenase
LDKSTIKQHNHALRLWNGEQKLHTQNAILAGEAACLVDPLTAEGIRPSIFSGVLASQTIDRALDGDIQALEKYTNTINEEWGTEMNWAQKLSSAFYRFPGIGYKLGVKRPSGTQIMSRILCGELRYSDIAGRALKRLMAVPGFRG